jgi:hypothetical protein
MKNINKRIACSVLVASIGWTGCAESIDPATSAEEDDLTAPRTGVDYSWARPSPSSLHASGYSFACRYVSDDTTGKNMTRTETAALIAAGVDVVSNWEFSSSEILNGFSAGVHAANVGLAQATAAGMPAGRPIYFSIDFDIQPSQIATAASYLDGAASVLGHDRVGAYGSYSAIKYLFDHGKIAYGWQTYAWSGGQWDARAQLRQTNNGAACSGGCDIDEAMAEDFGQWGFAPAPDSVVGYSPDLDGDGLGDLVATSTTGVLTSYVNTSTPGHPEFGIQKTIGSGWNGITKIAVLDIDNDGKVDLVGTSTTGVLTAYFNISTAQSIVFGNQLNFGSGWTSVTKLVVIDIDNDGRQDLVAVNSSDGLVAYLSNGTPGHPGFSGQPVIGSGWNAVNRIMVMDIDNDGKQDLVATNTSGGLVAYLSNGTPGHPGFSAQPVIGSGWNAVSRVAVIDIDNDGKQDLVATSTTGTLTAYLSNGTPGHPGFSAQPVIGSGWNSIAKIVVVDVDGDGKQDLLGMGTSGALTAYLSTGTPGHPGFVSQPPVIGSGWSGVSRVATVR